MFNYLSGSSSDMGDALLLHPRLAGTTFTGSVSVGRELMNAMASGSYPRPCIAEMGGKNACIVTADANLERATTCIVRSAYLMGGQKCSALSRLFVQSLVADELIERIPAKVAAMVIGDRARRDVYLGPVTIASAFAQYRTYARQLRERGSRVIIGGEVLADGPLRHGQFVAPTLSDSSLDHPLRDVEMFLPILMMERVHSNEEAMRLANASPLGLTAGVYRSPDKAPWFFDDVEAGVPYANRPQGATAGAWPGYQPFGGWNGSGSTGKSIASFYYLAQCRREQSQTIVE